jgi:intraflagellar transport protein 88
MIAFIHSKKRYESKIRQNSLDNLSRQATSMPFTPRTALKTGTSVYANDGRPMTSVRAAGYSSRGRAGNSAGKSFDPFNQAGIIRLTNGRNKKEKDSETAPEEVIKDLEIRIARLIEESTFDAEGGKLERALEKAKEAGKKERQLSKHREQNNLGDQLNLDLTFCVFLNLANQYHNNRMYQEALNSYGVIVKNKLFSQSGRMRVNMGNIYFEQGKYSHAVKMYRMALDQISNSNRDFRYSRINFD